VNTGPNRRPARRPLWKVLATVHAPLAVALAALALLEPVTGVPLATLIRDTVQVAGLPEHVGALSNVGALCWCAAAVVCFFGSAVLRRANRSTSRFLFWSGLFTTALLVDDLFLIHDGFLARELHIGDRKFYAAYATAAVAYFVTFRRALLAREPQLLAIAIGFFAVSIATDLLWHEATTMRYLLEDGAKLLGIVTWLVMFVRICMAEVLVVVERPPQ
jgi:hypothetical protein